MLMTLGLVLAGALGGSLLTVVALRIVARPGGTGNLPHWARSRLTGAIVLGLGTALIAAVAMMDAAPEPTAKGANVTAVAGASGEAPATSSDPVLARLETYAQQIAQGPPRSSPLPQSPMPDAAGRENLPEVSTMIARLAERLAASPDDAEGWRMLGWSHFHTGDFAAAAKAYERAVALNDTPEARAALQEAIKERDANAPAATPSGAR